ncbi:MAG: hypothetical protein QM639_16950 [Rhodocyclaceae bacterium]
MPAADNAIEAGFTRPPPGALIVLLPPPRTETFEKGEAMMGKQVDAQLKALGYRVMTLERADYEQHWSRETAAVGGIFDSASGAIRPQAYATALSALARHVCAEQQCELLIRQRLVVRSAQLGGSRASWDGTYQRIPVSSSNGMGYSFRGSATALSVELTAVTGQGGFAFRHFGGAALPYEANIRDRKHEFRLDLFEADTEVAEGVRIALEPLAQR